METASMNYSVEIAEKEWDLCPMRNEWVSIPEDHPVYGEVSSLSLFYKQEYNINIERWAYITTGSLVYIEFESEQDYILWKLHQ